MSGLGTFTNEVWSSVISQLVSYEIVDVDVLKDKYFSFEYFVLDVTSLEKLRMPD